MRKSVWLLGAMLALAISLPASADVVLHFTNGTSMPVRAYRFDGDMVHVDLGGNGQIAFPAALVDRVEDPKRSLNLKPSTGAPPEGRGAMTAGSSTTAGAAKRSGGTPSSARRNPGTTARPIETDAYGMAVSNAVPLANSSAATRLKNVVLPDDSAARNANASGGGNMRGAVRSGNRWVMAGDTPSVRPQAVGIAIGRDAKPAVFDRNPQPGNEPVPPAEGGSDE